jgi:hypothetical protein
MRPPSRPGPSPLAIADFADAAAAVEGGGPTLLPSGGPGLLEPRAPCPFGEAEVCVLSPAQAIRGLYEAFNARDAARVASFLTDDCVYEDLLLGPSTVCRGKAAFLNALRFHPAFITDKLFGDLPFASALPDLTLEIDSVAEGAETVGVEWHVQIGDAPFPLGRGLSQARVCASTGFPVPSLYLPCTFPVPSLYLPCRRASVRAPARSPASSTSPRRRGASSACSRCPLLASPRTSTRRSRPLPRRQRAHRRRPRTPTADL